MLGRVILRQCKQAGICRLPCALQQRGINDVHEPEYLQTTEPIEPTYDALNVQMKGYDYPVLESFQKFVHNTATNMGIDVEECWAMPPQLLEVQRYKPASTLVESTYNLPVYERNVQVVDLPATLAPVFFELLQAGLPEGVQLSIHEHLEEHENARYVPDSELLQLKSELESLGGPIKKRD